MFMLSHLARSTHTRPPQREWVQRSDTKPSDHARASCPHPVSVQTSGDQNPADLAWPGSKGFRASLSRRVLPAVRPRHWPPSFPRPCTVSRCGSGQPRLAPDPGQARAPPSEWASPWSLRGRGPAQTGRQVVGDEEAAAESCSQGPPQEPFPGAHTGPHWRGGESQRPCLRPGHAALPPAGLAGWGAPWRKARRVPLSRESPHTGPPPGLHPTGFVPTSPVANGQASDSCPSCMYSPPRVPARCGPIAGTRTRPCPRGRCFQWARPGNKAAFGSVLQVDRCQEGRGCRRERAGQAGLGSAAGTGRACLKRRPSS